MRKLPLILAAIAAIAAPARAQGIVSEWASVQPPPPPKLDRLTLDPATTALLVLDIAQQTCNPQSRPRCIAMLPRAAQLLAMAREKHWTVIYTLGADSKPSDLLAPIKPLGDEELVAGPPDKFIGTGLRRLLVEHHIKTLVAIGAASEGAVLHTAATAAFRGFDVVVPVDAMASATLYAEQYTAWDLVNAPRLGTHIKLSAVDLLQ